MPNAKSTKVVRARLTQIWILRFKLLRKFLMCHTNTNSEKRAMGWRLGVGQAVFLPPAFRLILG